ncbi:MAG TPA: amidohydrolase family protein [Caulobacteraceae bacterium]|jgi:L-fuconolactonase|nr:amidohydrolase family protein [Caulobacteraceae bacterium]
MIIDAHQHLWRPARGDYGWLANAPASLQREFGPADLAPLLTQTEVMRTILVQAAPTAAETGFLLETARGTSFVAGVVGWADLEAEAVGDHLAALMQNRGLVGVRPMIQDMADPAWMLSRAPAAGFAALEASGLRLDALVRPVHLAALAVLAQRHPRLAIVVDHLGKPDIGSGSFSAWAERLTHLARLPNVWVKLSGLLTEAGERRADVDLAPYVGHALGVFGAERTMWGSDWPVLTLAGDYCGWFAQARRLTQALGQPAQERIFGGTASAFYGV